MNTTSRFLAFVLFGKGPCVCIFVCAAPLCHCIHGFYATFDQCFSVQLTSRDIATLRTAAERRKVIVRIFWF
ncbi:hypothetical protein EDB83DRAFT_2414653 [Lactarius deliciosus]|nr:hypothetical protein EDB83DRAFT_2414653 [Lactarius deliciosus]